MKTQPLELTKEETQQLIEEVAAEVGQRSERKALIEYAPVRCAEALERIAAALDFIVEYIDGSSREPDPEEPAEPHLAPHPHDDKMLHNCPGLVLDTRAMNALGYSGLTLGEIRRLKAKDLRAVKNLGEKSIKRLAADLTAAGITHCINDRKGRVYTSAQLARLALRKRHAEER